VGTFGWSGAATTTFSVNPAEDMAIVIMGQVMPNDADLMQKVETLVYQALVDTPTARPKRSAPHPVRVR
jgi:CubicO group peptidase (beta-lactamase class C family)